MRRSASIFSPVRLGGFALAATLLTAAAGCQNRSSPPPAPPGQNQPVKPVEPKVPGVGPIQRPAVPPP